MYKAANFKVVNGNMAAALGAKLARPDIIAAYPITPQTPIVEYLTQFVADGELDASLSEVESEHSALSILQGASLAGGRVFTATSSQGLSLMYEPYFRTSTLRLPIVMVIVNREMISPQTVWGGPQDSMTLRDGGWVQIYVENNQEILDTVVQSFRLAEDKRVLLPVNVCYDGFYLSHMAEKIEVPDQETVDAFLPPYAPDHVILDPERPMSVDPLTPGDLLTGYRKKHIKGMLNALKVIQEVDRAYAGLTGRSYGGALDCYRMDDARLALVTLGSLTGSAREAVDRQREAGLKVGLVKVRVLRPFPGRQLAEALAGVQAAGVMDRNVCFGWGTGILYTETSAAAYRGGLKTTILPFIGGLGGEDITVEMLEEAISLVEKAAAGKETAGEARWLVRGMNNEHS